MYRSNSRTVARSEPKLIHHEWCRKTRELIESVYFPFLKAEFYIFDLCDTNGGLVRGSIVVIKVLIFDKLLLLGIV